MPIILLIIFSFPSLGQVYHKSWLGPVPAVDLSADTAIVAASDRKNRYNRMAAKVIVVYRL
jgi:hypothetical protein